MIETIRPATPDDIQRLVDLLMLDAEALNSADPTFWKMTDNAPEQIGKALFFVLTAEQQSFRQF